MSNIFDRPRNECFGVEIFLICIHFVLIPDRLRVYKKLKSNLKGIIRFCELRGSSIISPSNLFSFARPVLQSLFCLP